MKLDGAKVLLTGASGGIGHAIARALAARGASVVVTARRTDVIEALAAEIGGTAIAADLADAAAVRALAGQVGDVDVVVANAALPASGALLDFTPEEIDRAIDVNLRAPLQLVHALAPAMVARGRGHVVFISSLAGKAATPGSSLYSATKFGLRGAAAGLRGDLVSTGVGVSAVFPGFIRDAGMFADAGVSLPRGVGTRTPEDVASAVVDAIERNRGEVDVAPLPLRAGAVFAGIAPATTARVNRALGAEKVAANLAAGQSDKR